MSAMVIIGEMQFDFVVQLAVQEIESICRVPFLRFPHDIRRVVDCTIASTKI